MSQVSLNTRISPDTDKKLREYVKATDESIASIVDKALLEYLERKVKGE